MMGESKIAVSPSTSAGTSPRGLAARNAGAKPAPLPNPAGRRVSNEMPVSSEASVHFRAYGEIGCSKMSMAYDPPDHAPRVVTRACGMIISSEYGWELGLDRPLHDLLARVRDLAKRLVARGGGTERERRRF